MAKCLFCGRDRLLTKEHIYPVWLLEAFPHPDPTARNIRHLSQFSELREGADWISRDEGPVTFGPRVRCVCRSNGKGDPGCNDGWMSQLEGDVKPLMLDLAHGRRRTLSTDDQRLLAFWAAKTAVIVELTNLNSRAVSLPQRRWMYKHRDDRELFRGAFVFIGTLQKPYRIPLGYKHQWSDGRPYTGGLPHSNGQQTTFNINQLVLSIFTVTEPERLALDLVSAVSGLNGYVDLISPQDEPIAYPLKRLSHAQKDGFAQTLGAPISFFIDRRTGLRQTKFDPVPRERFNL